MHKPVEQRGCLVADFLIGGLHAREWNGRAFAQQFVLGTVEEGDLLRHSNSGNFTRVDDFATAAPG